MYLRFGDPSWDTPEPPDNGATGDPAVDRRRVSGRAAPPGRPGNAHLPVVEIYGVEFHAINEQQCIAHILSELDAGRGGTVVTPNLDHLRRCQHDVQFAALVAEADLVVADGMPIVWASRLKGTRLPERVAGSNLIVTLSQAGALRGRSVFLLGGDEGTAESAADVLRQRCPNIQIAGIFYPPPGFRQNHRLMDEMRAAIVASKPDIIYVALGSPKQEHLIADLRSILPTAWWLGVGISFSFISGLVKRAPRWMQVCGVEWIHRLCQEPRRLFKRYIVVGVPFGLSLLMRSMLEGISGWFSFKREPSPAPAQIPASATNPNGHGTNGHVIAGIDATANVEARLLTEPGANGNGDGHSHNGAANAEAISARTNGEASAAIFAAPGAIATSNDLGRLSRLRALVLLGGSVRPSPLVTGTGRSILDLPLDSDGTLLNFWLAQAREVAELAGLPQLPVRVLVNQASSEPRSADEKYFGGFRVERDLSEYRGTGGVLRDVAADYADDDLILVGNAAQILLDPLVLLVTALVGKRGDVALVSHEDGTPSGVMLVTCKALRLIGASGFVDMKEQALPQIAAKFDVRVLHRRRPTGLPVRTLEDYTLALRLHHRRRAGKPVGSDPLGEDFTPAFSLIEKEATVDGTSRIHDSLVLAGATVEAGAALVRCLVCPGAIVRKDRTAVDQLILPELPDRAQRGGTPVVTAAR